MAVAGLPKPVVIRAVATSYPRRSLFTSLVPGVYLKDLLTQGRVWKRPWREGSEMDQNPTEFKSMLSMGSGIGLSCS